MLRTLTNHALEREQKRLTQAGLNIASIESKVNAFAVRCHRDTALLVTTLPEHQNKYNGAVSNGDQVWAIIRGGRVVTFMFRRSTQPPTQDALRVQDIVIDD